VIVLEMVHRAPAREAFPRSVASDLASIN